MNLQDRIGKRTNSPRGNVILSSSSSTFHLLPQPISYTLPYQHPITVSPLCRLSPRIPFSKLPSSSTTIPQGYETLSSTHLLHHLKAESLCSPLRPLHLHTCSTSTSHHLHTYTPIRLRTKPHPSHRPSVFLFFCHLKVINLPMLPLSVNIIFQKPATIINIMSTAGDSTNGGANDTVEPSASDMKFFALVFKHLPKETNINWDQFAQEAGLKDAGIAKVCVLPSFFYYSRHHPFHSTSTYLPCVSFSLPHSLFFQFD